MSAVGQKETLRFQTEVRQLLDLMIHSLYSNKEIFLRELISNASDAADRLRFAALSAAELYEEEPDLGIRVTFDKESRTITVSDNGIGMSRDEVITNIGTIARSGTREFFKSLTGDQAKDANLIGQFGVGLYSAFIVADRVTIRTRRAGTPASEGVCWESSGDEQFTIEMVEKPSRGTEVTLHLRQEEDELLDGWRLRSIIRKFSDHISWPILMAKEEWDEEQKQTVVRAEMEKVNRAAAIWSRSKAEITAEEYNEFYKSVSHDFQEPLSHIHATLEGKYEYTVLFYIPGKAPFDLWDRDRRSGIKLYVRRVFIMDNSEELLPRYLRFVRGVVDSADLPLNVSREILQQSKAVEAIRKGAVGKLLGHLEEMAANQSENYQKFWKEFGNVFKEGSAEDHANATRIAKLLRFASTHTGTPAQEVGLSDYLGRMKSGQDKIYYLTGESYAAVAGSPHLEIFRKKGIEVLLMYDRIDEWLVSHLHEFDGKQLVAVTRGELDLGEMEGSTEKEELKKSQEEFKELLEQVKQALPEQVKEVRVSHRLTDSPSCLVTDEHDLSPTLERLLRSAGQEVPATKRILEINPTHPLVARLRDETDTTKFTDWCGFLHDQALLSEGGQLQSPGEFVRKLNQLLLQLSA